MGLNGDLYFSHAVDKDSRRDYCCFAAFPRIRTIVQKTAMSVIVKTSKKTLVFLLYVHSSKSIRAPLYFCMICAFFYIILSY